MLILSRFLINLLKYLNKLVEERERGREGEEGKRARMIPVALRRLT